MARLVFHVPSLAVGGAERVWMLMAGEMARRGHDTTLLVWNAEGMTGAHMAPQLRLADLGLKLSDGGGFGKAGSIAGLMRTAAFLRRERPDALFSALDFANLVAATALGLAGARTKFFPSFHAAASLPSERIGAKLADRLTRLTMRRAVRAIAVSRGVAADLERRHGIAADRIAVINNPLPPPAVAAPREATQDWQAALAGARAQGVPVIVTAGRLVEVKDHAMLIAAFALLRRERPAKLVLFGDGPLRAELQAAASRHGLDGDVLMPGFVPDPIRHYGLADLFAFTSRSEGFGNVLVEAMSAGLPVVSTDCEHGPAEILLDGALGALVPVGDAEGFARAMAAMLDAPTPAGRLRARAADFALERIGDHYEALLAA